MKSLLLIMVSTVVLFPLHAFGHASGAQSANDNLHEKSGWFCPWCGGQYQPYDPDRDRQDTTRSYRHWMGIDHRRPEAGPVDAGVPVDKPGAVRLAQSHLRKTGNQGLRPGGAADMGSHFVILVTREDGSPAGRLLVDKNTGAVRPAR